MSNLQELMTAVRTSGTRAPVQAYLMTITPQGSSVSYFKTIRTRRSIGEVRETVRQMARKRWAAFTFSVRPA